MGTRFIIATASLADTAYREMLVGSTADDVLLTAAFTGLPSSILRPSIVVAGLDPDDLLVSAPSTSPPTSTPGAAERRPVRWRDIWSAGHSVSGVTSVQTVEARADDVR